MLIENDQVHSMKTAAVRCSFIEQKKSRCSVHVPDPIYATIGLKNATDSSAVILQVSKCWATNEDDSLEYTLIDDYFENSEAEE